MKTIQLFEYFLVGIFLLIAVIAVLVFSFSGRGSNSVSSGTGDVQVLEVWGTIPRSVAEPYFNVARSVYEDIFINYSYKTEEDFETDFIQELASLKSPDLVLLPHELILENAERLFELPYTNQYEYSPGSTHDRNFFETNFISQSNIVYSRSGVRGFPYIVDPLVLYTNDDISRSAGVRDTPTHWNDLIDIAENTDVIRRDGELVTRALINLGGADNNPNMKAILSTLLLQVGNPIVRTDDRGLLVSSLKSRFQEDERQAESVVSFYTEFANPTKNVYTWNDTLPDARSFFIQGRLLYYIGFASEYELLKQSNPNLSISVSEVPQISEDQPSVFSRLYSFAVPILAFDGGRDPIPAALATTLSVWNSVVNGAFPELPLPSALDSYRSPPDSSTEKVVFENAAFLGEAWYDFAPKQTEEIFANIVKSIVLGTRTSSEALSEASGLLTDTLP